jgi:hypothetical protein
MRIRVDRMQSLVGHQILEKLGLDSKTEWWKTVFYNSIRILIESINQSMTTIWACRVTILACRMKLIH